MTADNIPLSDPDALEVWAATQPEAVQRIAKKVVIGLRQARPTDSSLMRKYLAEDVEQLKSAIEAARG